MSLDLHSCVPTALKSLAGDLHGGSLVLLDAGSAEVIASAAGIQALTSMGAVSVGDLHSPTLPRDIAAAAELAGGKLSSVVILLSTLLNTKTTTACITAAPYTFKIVVACGLSEAAHHDESPLQYSPSCYSDFCSAVINQIPPMEKQQQHRGTDFTCKFCPLLVIPIGDAAFVLPAGSAAGTASTTSGRPLGYSTAAALRTTADDSDDDEDDDDNTGAGENVAANPSSSRRSSTTTTKHHHHHRHRHSEKERATGVAALAHSLSSVAVSLGVRPEVFSLGPAAVAVGKSLSFVESSDAAPAAFVLIDRVVDVVAPSMHVDVLMQRVWALLGGKVFTSGGGTDDDGGYGDDDDGDEEAREWKTHACFSPVNVKIPGFPPPPLSSSFSSSEKEKETESETEMVVDNEGSYLPGSLLHPQQDASTTSHLGFLLTRQGKDAALFVRKWLREAGRKEGVPAALLRSKPGSAVTAAELRALSAALAGSATAVGALHRTAPLRQLAEAAAAALEEAPSASWDAVAREEKMIVEACTTEGSEAVCGLLIDLVGAAGRGGPVGLLHVLSLLMIAYQILPEHLPWYANTTTSTAAAATGSSSTGREKLPFPDELEMRLKGAMVDAVMACSSRWGNAGVVGGSSNDSSIGGGSGGDERRRIAEAARREAPWLPDAVVDRILLHRQGAAEMSHHPAGEEDGDEDGDEDEGERRALHLEVRDAVEEVFARLRELSLFRQRTFPPGIDLNAQKEQHQQQQVVENDSEAEGGSLLVRIATAIADRSEIKGLKHASTSLAGLLKSGLGRFGLQKQPQPGDYPVVVIFVIGGVSVAEIHHVLGCIDAKTASAVTAASGGGVGGERRAAAAGGGSSPSQPQPPPKIILGATTLLDPGDAVRHALSCAHTTTM